MRALPAVLALALLVGCDALGADEGSFVATLSGDVDAQYEGAALYRDDVGVPTIYLRDGDRTAFLVKASGGFREGTVAVSPASAVTLEEAGLWSEREAVSGRIVVESVTADEVTGTIDVGISAYGGDPYRFLTGAFRAVR